MPLPVSAASATLALRTAESQTPTAAPIAASPHGHRCLACRIALCCCCRLRKQPDYQCAPELLPPLLPVKLLQLLQLLHVLHLLQFLQLLLLALLLLLSLPLALL